MIKTSNLQSAVQSFVVNCIGSGFLIIIYFVVKLLSPYLIPLFWAVVLSIPLFDIKKVFLDYIEEDLKDDEITLFAVLTTSTHVVLGWACNPFYFVFYTIFKSYISLIHTVFQIKSKDKSIESPTTSSPHLSPGKYLAEKSEQEQKQIISDKLTSTFNQGTFYYFRLLLSFGTGLFLYDLLFVKQIGPVVIFILGILSLLHLIYLALHTIFLRYFPISIRSYISNLTKSKTKSFVLLNANYLLTSFIVIGSIICSTLISIFLAYKVINEFQYLITSSIDFVDVHLTGDLKDELHAQLSNAYQYGTNYIDDQLFMKNANVTTQQLSIKANNMFTTLPMIQSVYAGLRQGKFSILLNTTVLQLAFSELSSTTYTNDEASVMEHLKSVVSKGISQIGQHALHTGLNVFTYLVGVVSTLFDWIFKAIVFLTVLLYLVGNKFSILHYLGTTLEMVDPNKYITTALETCISSTFSVNLRLALFYFFFTQISFSACGLTIVYLPAIMSSVLAILPFINPVLISVPPALVLWLQGNMMASILLFASHLLASMMIIPLFYEEIKGVDTYFGSLSIALGIYTYGLEGVILGPILMSLVPTGYWILKYYLKEA